MTHDRSLQINVYIYESIQRYSITGKRSVDMWTDRGLIEIGLQENGRSSKSSLKLKFHYYKVGVFLVFDSSAQGNLNQKCINFVP